jgi:hypothetical protein
VAKTAIVPKSEERYFDDDDVIVTKTDATGRIVYANEVFLKISQYTEEEPSANRIASSAIRTCRDACSSYCGIAFNPARKYSPT